MQENIQERLEKCRVKKNKLQLNGTPLSFNSLFGHAWASLTPSI